MEVSVSFEAFFKKIWKHTINALLKIHNLFKILTSIHPGIPNLLENQSSYIFLVSTNYFGGSI